MHITAWIYILLIMNAYNTFNFECIYVYTLIINACKCVGKALTYISVRPHARKCMCACTLCVRRVCVYMCSRVFMCLCVSECCIHACVIICAHVPVHAYMCVCGCVSVCVLYSKISASC